MLIFAWPQKRCSRSIVVRHFSARYLRPKSGAHFFKHVFNRVIVFAFCVGRNSISWTRACSRSSTLLAGVGRNDSRVYWRFSFFGVRVGRNSISWTWACCPSSTLLAGTALRTHLVSCYVLVSAFRVGRASTSCTWTCSGSSTLLAGVGQE